MALRRPPRVWARDLVVRVAGGLVVRSRLTGAALAPVVWAALPVYGRVRTENGVLYIASDVPVTLASGAATSLPAAGSTSPGGTSAGALIQSPTGLAIVIADGAALPTGATVWAEVVNDAGGLAALATVAEGTRIALLHADS